MTVRPRPRHSTLVESWSPPTAYVVAGAMILLAGVLDAWTGPRLGSSILYLLPIALVSWRFGIRPGMQWAALAAGAGLGISLMEQQPPDLPVGLWNGGVALGTFLVVAASLGAARRLRDAERSLSGTDLLTGVLNGRSFHELVELERNRTLRYDRPFTLAYLDVDGFKRINEQRGHTQGDEALRLIATTIRENIRSMDSVARLGGDEFALLLPETGPGAAEVALAKIRDRLAELTREESLPLSFSVGAVICLGAPESVDRLIQRADSLMYAVKESGRNGVRTEVLNENYGIEAILQRS